MSLLGDVYYNLCSTRFGVQAARSAVKVARQLGGLREFFLPVDALELDPDAVAGLTRLWKRIHWSPGDGMMPPRQMLALYTLARGWPAEGDVVELGAWTGLTTCYLATACQVRRAGRVWAVDTFEGTKEGGTQYRSVTDYGGSTLQTFQDRVGQAGLSHLVTPLIGYTREMAQVYPGEPIRFLLIDADHSFDGVRRDFDLWLRHVTPGGLIVFHDYDMPEVAMFVDSCVRTDERVSCEPGHVADNIFAVTKK